MHKALSQASRLESSMVWRWVRERQTAVTEEVSCSRSANSTARCSRAHCSVKRTFSKGSPEAKRTQRQSSDLGLHDHVLPAGSVQMIAN